MSGTATDILNRFYAAYADHDYDGMMSLLSPDIEWVVSDSLPYGGTVSGNDKVLRYFRELPNHVEQGSMDSMEMFDSGDHVVVAGRWSSRSKTGVAFETPFANIYEIRGGKIISVRTFSDTAKILKAFA